MVFSIRLASESDLDQIHSIYEYYVLNTVAAFLINKPPLDYIKSRFEATRERGLPYLVAQQNVSDSISQIVGYAYASPFRGFMLGYGHSVEMTIFCHPDFVGKGVGSSLMRELLQLLKETKHLSREAGYEDQPKEFEIQNIIAVMSVDDEREDKGLGLRDWYVRWGFSEVGRLKKIGFKKGRWIDTVYLQRELNPFLEDQTNGLNKGAKSWIDVGVTVALEAKIQDTCGEMWAEVEGQATHPVEADAQRHHTTMLELESNAVLRRQGGDTALSSR